MNSDSRYPVQITAMKLFSLILAALIGIGTMVNAIAQEDAPLTDQSQEPPGQVLSMPTIHLRELTPEEYAVRRAQMDAQLQDRIEHARKMRDERAVAVLAALAAGELSIELCVDEPRKSTPENPVLLGYSRPRADAWALVEYTVTKEGTVRDATVLAKEPDLLPTEHVVEYVSRFTYDPRVVDGQAVEVPGAQHVIGYLARVIDEPADQPADDAYRCFGVHNDPYWRRVVSE